MRTKITNAKEAEQLAKMFAECHIESDPNGNTYLVIDRVRKRLRS